MSQHSANSGTSTRRRKLRYTKRFKLSHLGAIALLAATILSAAARTRPHYGGTLRVEIEGDPMQRDAAQTPEGIAWRLILDGLTEVDSKRVVRPALATRWTSENNDHRWQFWLRPGVSFQNDHPLTALAVVTSLEESCRASACPWTSIHVVAQSVVFVGDNAMPNLPAVLAGKTYLIKQASQSEDGSEPLVIGTGPFRVTHSAKNMVRLEANDDCWQGRPYLDAIEIYGRKPVREQMMDLAVNKADLIEVRPSENRQARQQRLNVLVSPLDTLIALEFNNLSVDLKLRAAIAESIDRNALQQVIFQKQGQVTAGMLPQELCAFNFLFTTERNLSDAQALRGGLTPPQLTIEADGNEPMQLAAERIALNLHDAGFNVRVLVPATSGGQRPYADLRLISIPLAPGPTASALDQMIHRFNKNSQPIPEEDAVEYKLEREFLDQHTLIPLLYLPHAWAVGERARDVVLASEGVPDLSNISLESAP